MMPKQKVSVQELASELDPSPLAATVSQVLIDDQDDDEVKDIGKSLSSAFDRADWFANGREIPLAKKMGTRTQREVQHSFPFQGVYSGMDSRSYLACCTAAILTCGEMAERLET